MSHSLTPGGLARVLRDLAANRKEGVLRIQLDGVAKAIFLRDGYIVGVDSDAPGESVAETVERDFERKRRWGIDRGE